MGILGHTRVYMGILGYTRVYYGIQKFGFINGVDNVNWPPYRDSKR